MRAGLLGPAAIVAAAAFALTPAWSWLAWRLGFVDRPDGRLKRHRGPVPYSGGLAVSVAFGAGWLLSNVGGLGPPRVLGGALLVLAVGLIDDRAPLHWAPKLAAQSVAAALAVSSGLAFATPVLPAPIATVASVLWLVAVTNGFNLVDVSDALCASIGMTAAAALALLAVLGGQAAPAACAVLLAAALGGFLPWNSAPARAYLGDGGAYFVGFVLAAVAIAIERANVLPGSELVAVMLILGAPVFDLLYVATLRACRGRNPFLGSDDHVAVRLRRLGWSPGRIALGAVLVTLAIAGAGCAAALIEGWTALVLPAIVVAAMAVGGAALRRRSAGLPEPVSSPHG